MNNVTSVSFCIDMDLKIQAEALFNNLGLDMESAFNMFLRQCLKEGRIPFEESNSILNSDTIAAIHEAIGLEKDSNTKTYTIEEALKELKA